MEPIREIKEIKGGKAKYWGTPIFEQQMEGKRPNEKQNIEAKERREWEVKSFTRSTVLHATQGQVR